jgi:two-component system, OmpR family, phosphate regulon sensor histidine kinase PhoR
MKRAIVKRFIVVLIVAMAISSIVISMSYYRLASHRVMEDMKSVLLLLDATIDWESSDLEKQIVEISSQMNNDYRITIIDNDGSVLADSETGNPETMENHKNRKEVKEAFQDGFGTKVRNSSTIKGSMMYAAYCSPTQHKVIRISIHHDVITDLMKMMVPSIAISLLLALSVAGVLTNKFAASVTKPILEISHKLEGIYDEKIDFNFPHYQYDELNIIARTTTDMSKSVQDYIRKLEKEKTIRQEFFSNASHELKTPLTAIRGYAELLQSGMASDTQMQKEFLGRIHSEVEEMTSLINDILMISRLETKELMPTKEMLCVKSVAEEVKKTLKPLADENNVSLEIHCCDEFVYMDRSHLQGILSNLMGNAVKYNRPGGFVQTDITMDSTSLSIRVEDSGIGIAKEDQKRIFERFYRVDKGRSKRVAGTGLGLSIVKHVTEFYGGCVSVESQSGVGSTFLVQLPAASLVQK